MPKKHTIEYMRELAAKKNGKCLSSEYNSVKEKLWWQCEENHKWEANPSNIIDGNWCRDCVGHPILDVAHCQSIASEKGGLFLSDTYKNRKVEYNWQCSEGHIFTANLNSIKYKNFWCKKCSGREDLTIESLQESAAKLGGRCLSTEYIGVMEFYNWECGKGHTWNAIACNVRYGFWCMDCRNLSNRNTIEDAIKLAAFNEGKFLSNEYITSDIKYLWSCKNNHTFDMTYSSVNSGHWCIYCAESNYERISRLVFESIFAISFIKFRPKWLMGLKGRPLELDGYCEDLNLAFEFNGIQHYKVIENWGMTEESLKEQQIRDNLKIQLCKENNVKLIIIKQEKDYMPFKAIRIEIIRLLEEENLIEKGKYNENSFANN